MTNNFFKNKIVIITGGTNSLGKAIASELVTQKADVVIIGNKKDVLLKTVKEIESLKRKNGRILSVLGDISTKEGCDTLFRDLRKVVNNFDVLINNDQFFNVGKFEDEKLEDIAKALNTNVTGTILVTKLAIPILKASQFYLNCGSCPTLRRFMGSVTGQGLCHVAHSPSRLAKF